MNSSLQNETFMVAADYMKYCMGIDGAPPSESAKAMRCLAKELENTDGPTLRTLVQKFLTASGPEPWTGLRSVMLELAGDGRLNWGRVVSLFAFMGMLASELYSRGKDVNCSRRLAEMLVDFLNGDQQEWLIQNGGWGGFTNFVHTAKSADQDSSVKKAVFAAAGMGIAGIAFLLVR